MTANAHPEVYMHGAGVHPRHHLLRPAWPRCDTSPLRKTQRGDGLPAYSCEAIGPSEGAWSRVELVVAMRCLQSSGSAGSETDSCRTLPPLPSRTSVTLQWSLHRTGRQPIGAWTRVALLSGSHAWTPREAERLQTFHVAVASLFALASVGCTAIFDFPAAASRVVNRLLLQRCGRRLRRGLRLRRRVL